MERNVRNECYDCTYSRKVPGNAHIKCAKPSEQVHSTGNAYGKRMGWFIYPVLFDPTWKEVMCPNFDPAISPAISQAVSPETEP